MSARSQFDDVVINTVGDALPDVDITVYDAGTVSPATLYTNRTGGTTQANPFATDETGLVQFWAEPGSYDLVWSDSELPQRIDDREFTWEAVSGADEGIHANQLPPVVVEQMPVGVILPFGASSAPTGFLLCDGSAVSRTTYSALWGVIASNYGSGNGSSTFNVPDMRGRVAVGVDGAAGRLASNDAIGNTSGAETKTLSTSEIPAHSHGITDPGHQHFGFRDGSNNIMYLYLLSWSKSDPGSATDYYFNNFGGGSDTARVVSNTTGITVNNAGSGSAHSIMQPYQVVTHIIKT